MNEAVSARLGIEPERHIVLNDEPRFPAYTTLPSQLCNSRYRTTDVYGTGIDLSHEGAVERSDGELLERLALENAHSSKLLGPLSYDGQAGFISPEQFWCYSNQQERKLSQVQDSVAAPIMWIGAKEITGGETCYVPAQLVYLDPFFDEEPPIRLERISTGAAAGSITSGNALARGLYEVIERHSCMASYHSGDPLTRVTSLPCTVTSLIDYVGRYRLKTSVYVIECDLGLPTIVAVTVDHTGIGPSISVGSVTSENMEESCIRAILESVQFRLASRLHKARGNLKEVDPDDIDSIDARMEYWFPLERICDLASWLDGGPEMEYAEVVDRYSSADFASVLSKLSAKGHSVYCVEISLTEMRELGTEVIKVLVPQLLPLYLDESAKALFSSETGPLTGRTSMPHPFL